MKRKNLSPLMQGIEIVHCLPNRIRLRFAEPLASLQIECIQLYIQQLALPMIARPVTGGQGLVVEILDSNKQITAPDVVAHIEMAANAGPLHSVSPPPTPQQIRLEKVRQNSIRVLMALAFAGWVLPVLPGLPFFLGAWWLGWRPPEKMVSRDTQNP